MDIFVIQSFRSYDDDSYNKGYKMLVEKENFLLKKFNLILF